MSIYQNSYFIVPRRGNYSLFEGLNLKSFLEDDTLFEDDLFWDNLRLPIKEFESYLRKNFLEDASWSDDLKIYGNNETNCIKLIFENGFVNSVSFRVNFKTDYSKFLNKLIEFCERNNLLVVDNDLNILYLDYQVIVDNINSSKAFENYKKFTRPDGADL